MASEPDDGNQPGAARRGRPAETPPEAAPSCWNCAPSCAAPAAPPPAPAASSPYYDSAWAAGGQPRLEPILDPVGVTPHIWEATVAGGGVELLDLPTFLRLSAFYNELRGGFDLLSQLRVLSETELVPLGDAPGSAFYDPATRRLRRRFAWYPANVRRLHTLAERLTVHGDSLATALDAPPP